MFFVRKVKIYVIMSRRAQNVKSKLKVFSPARSDRQYASYKALLARRLHRIRLKKIVFQKSASPQNQKNNGRKPYFCLTYSGLSCKFCTIKNSKCALTLVLKSKNRKGVTS